MGIYEKRLAEFKKITSRIEYMNYIVKGVLYWDRLMAMPSGSVDYRTKVNSFLGNELFHMISNPGFKKYTEYFTDNPMNDSTTDAIIKKIKRNAYFSDKTPEEDYTAYLRLIGKAEHIWDLARKDNDYREFSPYLKEIMQTFRKFADLWEYDDNPYDSVMSFFEPDLTVKKIDNIVDKIKPALIDKIKNNDKDKIEKSIDINIPEDVQKHIWKEILNELGFDFQYGRIDTGDFPIVLAYSPYDVRIINEYRDDNIKTGVCNVLHSGGKGIYIQSVDKSLVGTLLADTSSMLMEETIGRFYENIIGKSRGFTDYLYEKIVEHVPEFSKFTPEDLYNEFNKINISPVRLEADEFSDVLHNIIRYELERDMINDKIAIEDLNLIWNSKYQDYLGILPENDNRGILQDIHWATGYVGYFPLDIYADIYAAQLVNAMEKETGTVDSLFHNNQIGEIHNWLKENIFKYGSLYTTEELIERITGEKINPEYYLNYIVSKKKCY